MAYEKPITISSGIVVTYWVSTSCLFDFLNKKMIHIVNGYLNKALYTKGSDPIIQQQWTYLLNENADLQQMSDSCLALCEAKAIKK